MSWAAQYIGQPWVHGEHDCWAFFRRVQAERFGRQVPAIDVDAFDVRACVAAFTGHDERARWQEVQQPQEGDAVLMSQSRVPTHVGVWVDGGVLHCVRGAGVVFSSLRGLKSFPYNVTGYYRAA
jgi:cell wall-associated NlpC family hydrolase